MAFVLYLATTAALVTVWSRRVQRLSIAGALVLILLPAVFTGRALFTGGVYGPIDLPYQGEPLKSHAAGLGLGAPHNTSLGDLAWQMVPWQKAVRFALDQGEWPLWNPFMLCGDILAAAAQPAVYDPLNWIALLLPLPDAVTFGVSMTFFLAGFFTFGFGRSLGMREGPALVAAAGYAFCAMLAFYVGWPLGRAWAFLPLVLFAVRERRWALLTLALSLLIVAGHPETVLHVVFVGALYGLRHWREAGKAFVAGAVALGLTAVYLLPFAEAVPQTVDAHVRRELYAPTPYGKLIKPEQRHERIARTFLPWIHGDPLSTRVGFAVLLLALLARRREAWFFAALAVGGFLVACGIPPLPHLLHELPLFDIALNERLAFAGSFALAVLAGMGADRWPRLAPLLLGLVLIERVVEEGGIYPTIDRRAFYPPGIVSVPRDGLWRVAGTWVTLIPNTSAMYELEDVRGYEAMTFRRLAETYPLWSRYQTAGFNVIEDASRPFLSFLNVRYILDERRVIENPGALPRAFVPPRVRLERRENVVGQMKTATGFADLAWIESDRDTPHERVNGPGQISIRREGLGYELDATMQGNGWIVISDSAWKGWRAYLDGRRVGLQFANHAFLGLYVPAGKHRVRLVYLPDSFTLGRAISLGTMGILLIVFLVSRRRAGAPPARAGRLARR